MLSTSVLGSKMDRNSKTAVASGLYGRIRKHLGVGHVRSDDDLASLVEARLTVGSVDALITHGVTEAEIAEIVLPRRLLTQRRSRQQRLSRDESDRAVRLARIVSLAEEVFGDRDNAMDWLRAAKRRFGGRSALAMLATDAGARLVEEMLYQLDDGMAA
jgi:putative toxin-antitoxin system antitoxin component (TIGR02293 family)